MNDNIRLDALGYILDVRKNKVAFDETAYKENFPFQDSMRFYMRYSALRVDEVEKDYNELKEFVSQSADFTRKRELHF